MPEPTCRRCTAPTDSALCWDCTKRLLADLAALPDDLAELEVQVTRQSRVGAGGGARSAVRPLPYDPRASDLLDAARVTLVGWVRDTMAIPGPRTGHTATEAPNPVQPGIPGPSAVLAPVWPADTLPAMVAHLRAVHWTVHPAADEAAADIADLRQRIARCIDTPPDRHYLGPCTSVDADGHQCDGDVYAVDERIPRCTTCAAVYSRDERTAWLAQAAADQLVTAAEAIGALQVWGEGRINRNLLDSWVSRGRLVSRGHDARGHRTYRFDEVRTLAEAVVSRRRHAG